MGIYIKGMKLPEDCLSCPLACPAYMDRSLACTQTGHIADAKHAENERMQDCPLTEIPPHGRLIDADALIMDRGIDTYAAVFAVANAPTIIPAEPGVEET